MSYQYDEQSTITINVAPSSTSLKSWAMIGPGMRIVDAVSATPPSIIEEGKTYHLEVPIFYSTSAKSNAYAQIQVVIQDTSNPNTPIQEGSTIVYTPSGVMAPGYSANRHVPISFATAGPKSIQAFLYVKAA